MNIRSGVVRAACVSLCLGLGMLITTVAHAQYFTGDGWVRSNVIELVGGVGSASCDTGSPYVQAYEGQTGAQTIASATYTEYFHTNYPGVHNGLVNWAYNLVGTLGFFSNPTGYTYHSEAYDESATASDPDGYNVTGGDSFESSGTTYTFEAYLEASIINYGHASADLNAYVLGQP